MCLQQQKLRKIDDRQACVLRCLDNPNLRVTPSEIRGSGGRVVYANWEKMSLWKKEEEEKITRQQCTIWSESDNILIGFIYYWESHNILLFLCSNRTCSHVKIIMSLCVSCPRKQVKHHCSTGMTLHPADYLSTVALEAVLASDSYFCATWDYIQSDLLDYLQWYR